MNTHPHTPYPWHIAEYGETDPSYSIVQGDKSIATITGPRRNGTDSKRVPTQEESAANARLIRAAPEMFAILVEIINEFDPEPDSELRGRIKAFISKSKGEA